jgi:CheY-like chemotaxis protein
MRVAGQVLVIDDDEAFLSAIRALLRDEGYAVETATSVGAALDRLWAEWEQQPDVILLDLHLPSLDGQTFAELYRLLPVPQAPIVVVSGATETEVNQGAQAVNAAGVLLKPFELDELLACIYHATHAEKPGHPSDPAAHT